MMASLSEVYLARHGETAWTLTRQHTGRTDVPLTPRGEQNARSLAPRLKGVAFARVLVSPLSRARRTCELAGFGDHAEVDPGPPDGITASTKAGAPLTFVRSGPTGLFFVTSDLVASPLR